MSDPAREAAEEARKVYEAAVEEKEKLLKERRANRESMTKAEFRAYNENTRQKQIDVQKAVDEAQRTLSMSLDRVRHEVAVGTVEEGEGLG